MTLKKYLLLMLIGTAMSWLGCFFVIFLINPAEAGWQGKGLFYASFFMGFCGLISLGGFFTRFYAGKKKFAYEQVKISFRQGITISLLATGSLFLAAERVLTWWNLALLFLLACAVEYEFFQEKQQEKN